MIIDGQEIKLYYPDGEQMQDIKEFVGYYSDCYYKDNKKEVEDEIEKYLNNGIKSPVELFRVLAWSFMKIDMEKSKSDAFRYKEGMNEEELQLRLRSKKYIVSKKDINDIYKIVEEYSKECDTNEKAQNFLKDIKEYADNRSWSKLFPSFYMITLLYFVSNGKYPIANNTSRAALYAINNNYD